MLTPRCQCSSPLPLLGLWPCHRPWYRAQFWGASEPDSSTVIILLSCADAMNLGSFFLLRSSARSPSFPPHFLSLSVSVSLFLSVSLKRIYAAQVSCPSVGLTLRSRSSLGHRCISGRGAEAGCFAQTSIRCADAGEDQAVSYSTPHTADA